MALSNQIFLDMRTHHIVIVRGSSIVVAVALVSNFYLWCNCPCRASGVYLFDTTLRDGAQTNGVDFTLADKLAIARMLDELGVDYIEAGYPGANPIDTEFFRQTSPGGRAQESLRSE